VLDTWPYNAHTTCIDALQAGAPVLTLPGSTFAARVAASILDTAGLSKWIATDPEQYVKMAVGFAGLLRSEIIAEKKRIFETFWQSPMVDNQLFGNMLASLCLNIYDRTVRGMPLQDLRITPEFRLEVLPFSRKTPQQFAPVQSFEHKQVFVSGGRMRQTEDEQMKTSANARIESDPAIDSIKIIVVLGPYSSGTTAVTGYLARLGAFSCPPHYRTNDPKTPDSYESRSLRDFLVSLVDEISLTPRQDSASEFAEWFPEWIREQKSRAFSKGFSRVIIKHPLASFFIKEIQETCQPAFIVITRPFEKIEKSRERRGWHAVYGRQGAKVIYNTIFNAIVDQEGINVLTVDYASFRSNPAMDGRLLSWTGMDPSPDTLSAAKKWVF
jgi:hypothetical protein